MKTLKTTLIFALLVSPGIVFAQGIFPILGGFYDVVRILTGLAAAAAVLVFFWGLAKFILKSGSEDAAAVGKQLMLWGIVALFVMVSWMGIISIIQGEFGFRTISPEFNLPQ